MKIMELDLNKNYSETQSYRDEVWEELNGRIEIVDKMLDQNEALIRQVKMNHASKIPDNLVKNVALINEININISKISSIYGDISVSFKNIVRRPKTKSKNRTAMVNDDLVGSTMKHQ
ncbi:hypothetical protein RND81_04G158100 [Saponaria officinalis]|uniref:Protein EARLY FLOWERING 4 domain-containing protein n=1 Tax=Saponaria officinalis TaxID=3572 RepID=A0AAW1LF33_SAPOF